MRLTKVTEKNIEALGVDLTYDDDNPNACTLQLVIPPKKGGYTYIYNEVAEVIKGIDIILSDNNWKEYCTYEGFTYIGGDSVAYLWESVDMAKLPESVTRV